MEVSIGFWIGFIVFIVIMLALDLFVFHKKDTVVNVKEALLWSAFWIGLALVFNLGIYIFYDHTKAIEFFTAYVLEKSLSVDNLFVFIMIFGFFNIKPQYQHRILFWGILGALVMRAVFIFAGVALIERFAWIMYVFGAFLIYTGIHMLFEKKDTEEFDPNKKFIIRIFRKIMRVTDDMSVPHFFVKKNNILYATPFFVTLLFIEASDLIFAVDSIPAVLSVSKDTFIVFTSNIFAILGLRSLYFALSGVMDYFHYLKYALAGILTFIGIKMCVNELAAELNYSFHISNFVSLGIILASLTLSIVLSVIVKKKKGLKPTE
ncbi:MAG: TerC family protein [Paludibacter sp.]|nr:TerC family protein [Paludibacter sp.]